MNFASIIAEELKIENWRVEAALKLMEEGGTVPFIARYRKDQTGTLDEVQLRDIQHRLEYLRELQERKTTVLKTIEEQGKLSAELRAQIEACRDKTLLEDIYAPYKPRKRTRATIAKELGLEPLARIILAQEPTSNTMEDIGRIYLNEEVGLADPMAAVNGALDILAEEVADNTEFRQYLRMQAERLGVMVSKVRKEYENQETKFKNYYDYSEPLAKMAGHRVLALRRGEKEKVLRVSLELQDELFVGYLASQVVTGDSIWKAKLEEMCKDSWERLLKPSLETEVRLTLKERAEQEAYYVFSKNLGDILLAPPAGHKSVLALDPGFKSGIKVAVLDKNGKFLDHTVIYPHEPQKQTAEATKTIVELVEKYSIELIAIGNGTASRETEAFVASIASKLRTKPLRVIVNESGASVYSASMIAIEEFPKEDVTTRGAISIGRRLQDPLAELVKVEAKAIGVGQYQHDVNQKELQKRLDEVVETCVNVVGVDLNSASEPLLSYVSGISKTLAQSIVSYRNENGSFKSRSQLMNVKHFGPKSFEQAAGFLRVPDAENPLDCSAVHPEHYPVVEEMAQKAGLSLQELVGNAEAVKRLPVDEFVEKVGKHTLEDILAELEKPNRDPRREFRYARFDDKIQGINDLVTGSWMEGVVTNVTNFGAFVDIGVHQDGLVHISEMSDTKFIKDAKEFLTLGDVVKVRVLGVDTANKRIGLSMKQEVAETAAPVERGQRAGGPRGQGNQGNRGPGGPGAARGPRSPRPEGQGQQRGGYDNNRRGPDPRQQQRGGQGSQNAPVKAPLQAHATIADLKAQLTGKAPGKQPAKKAAPHPGKLPVNLKEIMKSGR